MATPTDIPYAIPSQNRSGVVAAAAALLVFALGLIFLGGCFLIGVLYMRNPQVFFGPAGVKTLTIGDHLFVAVLYLAAFGCFVGAIWVGLRGVQSLLRILHNRVD